MLPSIEQAKAFRVEVMDSSQRGKTHGTIVVRAKDAKQLENEIRNELTRWRVKFSNRSIQIATKKAMKFGSGFIGEVAHIVRVCDECYGSGVDYFSGQPCSACGGSGVPEIIAEEAE